MKIHIGDILEINLPNKKKAYAQYIYKDKHNGDLIKVFNYFRSNNEKVEIEQLKKSSLIFPPVFTSVKNAIEKHNWIVIGNTRIENFIFPNFISTIYYLNGKAGTWFLYDGQRDIPLGKTLPEEYKKLEFLSLYSPELIVERIMTGKKPMEDLINTNKTQIKNKD